MGKKDTKPKFTTVVTKQGESLKVFEDMETFERFIKDSEEDDNFNNVHCQIHYYPPFVMHASHDNEEKVKDTDNSHNKKFVRHVHQHVEKHLLKEIKDALDMPDLKFHDKNKEETFEHVRWHYGETAEHKDKKFKIDINVTCLHDTAMVDVDYATTPIV
ncbi:hypothetical protein TBLA_0J01380 [Henningerozyma blattae CBS 6284]|uniref:Respiratory growth induced protein 1 n=1 Tax=Henningerozyma blattae (strain ATCC 34711 / CBS 6284 / DSM 70876 / NBRC 10599 / NRRL Y-10934 / UCD 77-7) TaxID=1071380 RepID=I2H9T2_HENB6|nr:hypothetical protein TBLA_0J01380 [Tetrapisispora blattae CBS 6284]CCH63134.1 hypothetical protein TBLA_0J01380 [Tetrapisispora blattae CBS 6284]